LPAAARRDRDRTTGKVVAFPKAKLVVAEWLSGLYRAHWEGVCAFIGKRYGSGPPDPEDVAQQVFVRLATMDAAMAEQVVHPKSFLYRMAENVVLDEKRRAIVRAAHARETMAGADDLAGCDTPIENVLVAREDLALIEKTIRAMPDRRRQCFLLHRMEELSCAEIGRRLGVSHTAARKHVERALADIEIAVERGAS
jgi:RNA polymerase sigma factor (sigma-70 family)